MWTNYGKGLHVCKCLQIMDMCIKSKHMCIQLMHMCTKYTHVNNVCKCVQCIQMCTIYAHVFNVCSYGHTVCSYAIGKNLKRKGKILKRNVYCMSICMYNQTYIVQCMYICIKYVHLCKVCAYVHCTMYVNVYKIVYNEWTCVQCTYVSTCE